tara:strand:- start:238 stop:693 length:456 start_codon:yes stop_codon:yes gene_type:complete
VERRRTVTENVTVDFFDAEDGHTRGHFVANEDTYGSDRYWVLLKPKSVALEDFGDDPEEEELDRCDSGIFEDDIYKLSTRLRGLKNIVWATSTPNVRCVVNGTWNEGFKDDIMHKFYRANNQAFVDLNAQPVRLPLKLRIVESFNTLHWTL